MQQLCVKKTNKQLICFYSVCMASVHYRAVAIRFGVVRLIVHAQERYSRGPGGMLPQKFLGYEIASETNFGPI